MFKKLFFKQIIGARGEKKAAKYLAGKGYKIVDLNMRTPFGEIDIIASDNTEQAEAVLVFVEVKTRGSGQFGAGLDAITVNKQRKLIRSAQYYCKMKDIMPLCRFDVISIDEGEITHVENAFICNG